MRTLLKRGVFILIALFIKEAPAEPKILSPVLAGSHIVDPARLGHFFISTKPFLTGSHFYG